MDFWTNYRKLIQVSQPLSNGRRKITRKVEMSRCSTFGEEETKYLIVIWSNNENFLKGWVDLTTRWHQTCPIMNQPMLSIKRHSTCKCWRQDIGMLCRVIQCACSMKPKLTKSNSTKRQTLSFSLKTPLVTIIPAWVHIENKI